MREAFARVFYLQFIVRKELAVMKEDAVDKINANKELLKQATSQEARETNSFPKINPHSFSQLSDQLKHISDYLCDKE